MKKVENYEISLNTMALIEEYHLEYNTIIYDVNGVYCTKQTVHSLLEDACMKRLSTYEGRLKSVRKLLNYSRKTPLLICPQTQLCAFPLTSPQKYGCPWIFAHHVLSRRKIKKDQLAITFHNGTSLSFDCSLGVFEKQLGRTANCLHYYQRMMFRTKQLEN
ncbi:competence protein ComK [Bacillus badius]|uniref:competence protein ComK n=1 Tax=Bacillus badius TaxID=1455 RepID=UPI002E1A0B65|nr:competence protein ComK [Bacillus badius]MED0665564.1 competence protein ComK [Bacillus badius]